MENRKGRQDPAYQLGRHQTFADGATIAAGSHYGTPAVLDDPVTFHVEVEVTTLATATGVIFEIGDAVTGVALALDGGDLVAAAGGQGNDGASGTATGLFAADGDRRSLVVSTLPGTGQLQVWSDGDLVIDETAVTGSFANWSANSDGAVGSVNVAVTARIAAPLRVSLANAAVIGNLSVYPKQLPKQFRR